MLERRAATLVPLTEAITQRTIALMESITSSRGLQMRGALIAATALDHGLLLFMRVGVVTRGREVLPCWM